MRAKQMPEMKTKEEVRDELDEIEKLMEKMKSVSSRSERRRLLAQYNRKQALQYGQKAAFGTTNALVMYDDQVNMLEIAQEVDDSLTWNPKVGGYVDRELYEEALKTKDPTAKGYKGVSPNFGGGNV